MGQIKTPQTGGEVISHRFDPASFSCPRYIGRQGIEGVTMPVSVTIAVLPAGTYL